MSAPPVSGAPSSGASWRTILNWVLLAVVVFGLIVLVTRLRSSLAPPSFAIIRPENAGRNALLALLGAVGVLAVTSYIGKLIGERGRAGRKVSYVSVLGDQLTHLFVWIVILVALYPIFYVVAASFDPLNTLASSTLGDADEPLLVRARVLPSLEGKNFANYAKLFDGVIIYAWQWIVLAAGLAGLLGLAWLWFSVQTRSGGVATLAQRNLRPRFTWLAAAGVLLFFIFLTPGQFTGTASSSKFLLWLRNTFLISGLTGLIAVGLTTTAGYAMARLRFPGRFQALLFFIFIQMFPGFLGLVATYSLLVALGLVNTFTGLILAYSGGAIAFGTWIYKGYVESLPESLEEAALVDGANRWSAFVKIVLPLSGPMLVFIFLLQFIGTYAEFLLANTILTGAENWNIGLGLRSFQAGAFGATEYGVLAAAAVLGSLPIVALFYSFQQVFVSGTTSGGVKG